MSVVRENLRKAVRSAWDVPEAEPLRTALASQAYGTGFAKCLEDHMKRGTAGKAAFEACAEKAGLKRAYKGAWGKPA